MSMRLAVATLLAFPLLTSATELADPTRPAILAAGPAQAATQVRSFRLSLVRIGSEDRTALVNDILVRIGDIVDGAEVQAIDPGRVRMEVDGRPLELVLSGADRVKLPEGVQR